MREEVRKRRRQNEWRGRGLEEEEGGPNPPSLLISVSNCALQR
jgi:hypothetical protein